MKKCVCVCVCVHRAISYMFNGGGEGGSTGLVKGMCQKKVSSRSHICIPEPRSSYESHQGQGHVKVGHNPWCY